MMLERIEAPNGVVFYRSPALRALGVPHGFSTRLGGISRPPFDSLNLGNPNGCDVQDDYANVWANYARLQEAIGAPGRRLLHVHQVHGGIVADAPAGREFNVDTKADAIVTDDPRVVASVRIADCVPVLLSTADGRRVAAVHAGWRGVVAGIVTHAVQRLGGGATLSAAIGPCIGFDAFEVGPEVIEAFERLFSPAPVRRRADGKGTVDLREAVRRQLLVAGVAGSRIDTTDRCTHRDADEFFSHRRDNGLTGRLAAVIGTVDS